MYKPAPTPLKDRSLRGIAMSSKERAVNILILVAEVSLALIIFFVLDWLVVKVFQQLAKVSFLKKGDKSAKTLRRNIQQSLILSCAVLCLRIAGANGVLIYQGKDIQQY